MMTWEIRELIQEGRRGDFDEETTLVWGYGNEHVDVLDALHEASSLGANVLTVATDDRGNKRVFFSAEAPYCEVLHKNGDVLTKEVLLQIVRSTSSVLYELCSEDK